MAERSYSISIEGAEGQTAFERLAWSIRQAIHRARLKPGTRLPSTRELHQLIKVSRSTIVEVFEQLIAEGYLESRPGSGTFVAENLPEELFRAEARGHSTRPVGLPPWIEPPVWPASDLFVGRAVPFRPGLGAIDLFPVELWARLTAKRYRAVSANSLGYGDPAGDQRLRELLAAHISFMRGMPLKTAQVIITSGSQQALQLALSLTLRSGDTVHLEEPGYPAARASFKMQRAKIRTCPVDSDGAKVPSSAGRLIFLTPSFQYPLGIEMSLSRRMEMLAWAERTKSWIIEDDYDCEFRYVGKPTPSLQALGNGQNVLYCLSFSKSLAPALRLGCLVVPERLVEAATKHLHILGRGGPVLEQRVFADFIEGGHFRRQMRVMREALAERRAALLSALSRLESQIEIQPCENGLHIPIFLKRRRDDVEISNRGKDLALHLVPLSPLYLKREHARFGFLLGFGASKVRALEDGVERFRKLLLER